jgi:hypothetical protein
MVLAAALAVAIMSGVGVAFAPHADSINVSTMAIIKVYFILLMDFIFFLSRLLTCKFPG